MPDLTPEKMSPSKMMPRETQVQLVMTLLERNGERSANQIRKRAAKGEGVTAKGVEFDLSILNEALATWDAQHCQAAPAESPHKKKMPPAASPKKKSSKRKCASADDRRDPAKAAKTCTPKPSVGDRVDENTSGASAATEAMPAASKPAPEAEGSSVKELNSLLAAQGIDHAGCVEKSDLQALWGRFEMWRQRPLSELQDSCEVEGGPRFNSVDECARYLATGTPPVVSSVQRSAPAAQATEAGVPKEQDALREVQRILPLRKESFKSAASWGFAVLEVASTCDVSAVQRAYRSMMRKLRPDRAGQDAQVARAFGLVREAKEAGERSLSRQEAPLAPRHLWHETLSSVPGQRRFKLHWTPPEDRVSAPIRRYVVAVFDPAYGRALTIAILEPDYSEESRSFVGIESLTAFEFSEEDFQKMPKLWKQTSANVQVAAANKAGQSAWATLQVPLDSATSLSKTLYRASTASVDFHSSAVHKPEDLDMWAWDAQLRKLRGEELRAWLEPQKKAVMAVWLKSMNWFAQGSKNDILERVIFIREAMPS